MLCSVPVFWAGPWGTARDRYATFYGVGRFVSTLATIGFAQMVSLDKLAAVYLCGCAGAASRGGIIVRSSVRKRKPDMSDKRVYTGTEPDAEILISATGRRLYPLSAVGYAGQNPSPAKRPDRFSVAATAGGVCLDTGAARARARTPRR